MGDEVEDCGFQRERRRNKVRRERWAGSGVFIEYEKIKQKLIDEHANVYRLFLFMR